MSSKKIFKKVISSDINHKEISKKIRFISNTGIKYMKDTEINGSFIVIEGPDASGRSTQIQKITEKLEADGHAVVNTGLKRSDLISKGIIEAKRNYVGRRTMALYYAADFADQLENKIIPALKAGFVVISDRYIYTLIARSSVRGIDKNWLHQLLLLKVGLRSKGFSSPVQKNLSLLWLLPPHGL